MSENLPKIDAQMLDASIAKHHRTAQERIEPTWPTAAWPFPIDNADPERDPSLSIELGEPGGLHKWRPQDITHHNLLVVMQTACIEAEWGRGHDIAMEWIRLTLERAGLDPTEHCRRAVDAPADGGANQYFDSNKIIRR